MFGIKDLPVAPPFIMLVLSDDVHQETTRDSEDQGGLIHIDRDDFSSPRRQRPTHLLSPVPLMSVGNIAAMDRASSKSRAMTSSRPSARATKPGRKPCPQHDARVRMPAELSASTSGAIQGSHQTVGTSSASRSTTVMFCSRLMWQSSRPQAVGSALLICSLPMRGRGGR